MSADRSSLPIAVIDSGIGGLTVLHEMLVSLPAEDYLYLGDTEGFPYGTKSAQWLRPRIELLVRFAIDRGAKMLVVACNSATSAGADLAREVAAEHGIGVLTVVDPEAEIAAAITESGRIGVLATPTTVEGGAYRRALDRYAEGRELEVVEVAAPDLAPIIQSGFPFDQRVIDTVRSYCEPFKRAGTDTLILGCTHYPLVAPMLQRMLGRDVRLVTAGHAVAATAQRELEGRGLEARGGSEGEYRFLCTGEVDSFRELGTRFLQMPLGQVEHVELDEGSELGGVAGDPPGTL
jgi:glutamate racemase